MRCGIDFGTVYSSVSCYDEPNGRYLPVDLNCEGGRRRMRSDVFYPEEDKPALVGSLAWRMGRRQPRRLVSNVKQHMGRDVTFPVSPRVSLSPKDVASAIFRALRDEASQCLGTAPTGAVITVPAWFGQRERQETLEASVLAGFEADEVSLLEQPQAALLAHLHGCAADNKQQTFTVFDFGGGLDLAVIRMMDRAGAVEEPASYELLAIRGSRDLGGLAWDSRAAEILGRRLLEATGTDPTASEAGVLELLREAECAKLMLSSQDRAVVIFASSMQEIEVTRTEFEEATSDLLCAARTHLVEVIGEACQRQGIPLAEMTVLPCGGGTSIPSVRRMLAEVMGREQEVPRDVETIGATGAAIWAHMTDAQSAPRDAGYPSETVTSDRLGVLSIGLRGRSSYGVGIEVRDENGGKHYQQVLAHGMAFGVQHAVSITCSATHDSMRSIQIPLASYAANLRGPEGWVRCGTLTAGPFPEGIRDGDPISIRLWFDDNGVLRGDVTDLVRGLSLSATLDRGEIGTGRQRVERFAFSAFYPERIPMGTTGRILAYAHIESQAHEVVSQVAWRLEVPRDVRIKAGSISKAIPMRSLIRVVPDIAGLEFDRHEALMSLWEDVQSVEFRFQARPGSARQACDGLIRFWLEGMPLADVPVTIWVGETDVPDVYREALTQANAKPYRAVFPSYSHKDAGIVEKMEVYAAAFGDEYLRDVRSLRCGQSWNNQILRFIGQADVFQLFWSDNAASSEYVEQEWRRALSERGSRRDPYFLRPVYWAERPASIPGELRELQFTRLPL